jgi:hypothetical protein
MGVAAAVAAPPRPRRPANARQTQGGAKKPFFEKNLQNRKIKGSFSRTF